jgi:hypothetical protein
MCWHALGLTHGIELPTDVREKLRLAAELTVAPLDNSESELEKSLVAGENTLDFNLTK